jgi:hypothetical protein
MWSHVLVHLVNFSPTLFLLVLLVVSRMDGQAIVRLDNLPALFPVEDESSEVASFWRIIFRTFAYALWAVTNGPRSEDEWGNLSARLFFLWALANVMYSILYSHKVHLVVSSGLLLATTLSFGRYYSDDE